MSGEIGLEKLISLVKRLSEIDRAAAREMLKKIESGQFDRLIIERNAYILAKNYGEVSAALAAEIYDLMASTAPHAVAAALPAEPATVREVVEAIDSVYDYKNPTLVSEQVGRLVKRAGQDTIMQNAERDGAEFAWMNIGDSCAFCITLASRGWQRVTKRTLRKGHAEHIHANCDCSYVVRFSDDYLPDLGSEAEEMYYGADGVKYTDKINSIRRQLYAENRDEINAQKRAAYRARVDRQKADTQD